MSEGRMLAVSLLTATVLSLPLTLRIGGLGGRLATVAVLVAYTVLVWVAAGVRARVAGWYLFELPDRSR